MIRGVLFDMDGVLIDSEAFICQAAIRMFAENGLHVKEKDFLPFVGAGEDKYIGGVAEKYGFQYAREKHKARTYEIYNEISKGKLNALPGVHHFLLECKKRGLRTAVVTSA